MSCVSLCPVHCSPQKDFKSPASPYPELLSSTTVPSDFHISAIREVIDHAETEISARDRSIARLEHEIVEIGRQRAELEDFVNKHRGVVSAMRRLPSEIMLEIFAYGADPPPCFNPRNCMSWRIIQVCSRWRAVALASPLLWCRFILRGQRPPGLDAADITRVVSLQLQWSSQAPLSILFETGVLYPGVLDAFLTASMRWQDVRLDLTLQQYQRLFSSGADFPILKKLAIKTWEPLHWPAADVTRFFESVPSLEDLELSTAYQAIPGHLMLPWAQLRKCTFNRCTLSDVLRFLAFVSPGTQVSTVGLDLDNELDFFSTSSRMRALTLQDCYSTYTSNFLSALTMPALEELVIEDAENKLGYSSDLTQQLVALLSRSACPLTRLCIGARVDEHELLEILASPSAHSLVALDVAGGTELSEHAIVALATPTLLPHLRDLALTCSPFYGPTEAQVLAMVASRRPVLCSLRLEYEDLSQEAVDTLRESGLEIVLL